jgi:hypothetical protein
MADYDTRNNAAIAKAASFDASGWSASDTGLALLADEMATKLDQARNQAPDGAPLTHTGAVAHAADVTGAPQWVLVAADRNGTPNIYGFVRTSSSDPWRQESYATPAAAGAAATPSQSQMAAATEAAGQVSSTVAAMGQGPIVLTGEAATMVRRLASDKSGLGAESLTITATPDPEQGLRVVVAGDGSTLALVSHRVKATFTASASSPLRHGPDFAAVLGQSGDQQQLVYDFALFSLLKVNEGDATMLGSSAGNLPPAS